MKLRIPFTRLSLVVSLELAPREAGDMEWVSWRGMILIAACAALFCWGGALLRERWTEETTVNYVVGDLVKQPSDLNRMSVALRKSVPEDAWSARGRQVVPFFLNHSLIVRDTASGHARVRSWLDRQRTPPRDPSH